MQIIEVVNIHMYMVIKKGIIFRNKLYIRINFNIEIDKTICNKVSCRHGSEDANGVVTRIYTNDECIKCRKARFRVYSPNNYSFVPYDN
jgi:hypothetical protein